MNPEFPHKYQLRLSDRDHRFITDIAEASNKPRKQVARELITHAINEFFEQGNARVEKERQDAGQQKSNDGQERDGEH